MGKDAWLGTLAGCSHGSWTMTPEILHSPPPTHPVPNVQITPVPRRPPPHLLPIITWLLLLHGESMQRFVPIRVSSPVVCLRLVCVRLCPTSTLSLSCLSSALSPLTRLVYTYPNICCRSVGYENEWQKNVDDFEVCLCRHVLTIFYTQNMNKGETMLNFLESTGPLYDFMVTAERQITYEKVKSKG